VKKAFVFFIFFIIKFSITPIFPHDSWLVPQKFKLQPGEVLTIMANTGMDFPKSLNAVLPERLNYAAVVGKALELNMTDLRVQGNSLLSTCILKNPGTYVAAIALKPRKISLSATEFNEYLLHDGLADIYELRKQEGILDKNAVEYYSKYPKTVIQVGNRLDNTPTQPLNLPLEIVPVVNPYTLKKGDKLSVTVFFKGKTLTGQELAWSFPGQGEKFAGTTKTDSKGRALVPLEKKGPYVIRLTHMEWVRQKTHEWESYWASLTFFVSGD
jgi:LysM repeat protein